MGYAHDDSVFLQIAADGANPEIEAMLHLFDEQIQSTHK
jgi:hypothetical protein